MAEVVFDTHMRFLGSSIDCSRPSIQIFVRHTVSFYNFGTMTDIHFRHRVESGRMPCRDIRRICIGTTNFA